jgi:hypothetical protein
MNVLKSLYDLLTCLLFQLIKLSLKIGFFCRII